MTNVQMLLICSLQKFIKENVMIKHFIIFFSIFIFTFVLGWYNFDSLQVETYINLNKNKIMLIKIYYGNILNLHD